MKHKVIMIKKEGGADLVSLNVEPKDLHGKFCSKPFETLSVRDDGSCWMCCTSWLPYSIGNLNEQSFEDIWHGEVATIIRESILDGSFRYCNHTVCGDISDNRLPDIEGTPKAAEFPTHIMFENDASCNLTCPNGYYGSPDYKCLNCKDPCQTCEYQANHCLSCLNKFYYDPVNFECFKNCENKSGYY
jgi:hypothetical protein